MGKKELEQTKGRIKITGIVSGIHNENAKREGFSESSDKEFKALAFFVQTSKENRVKVELFGMERDHVYAYSSKKKESKKIEWAKRHDDHGDYKVLGVNLYLEKGKDGKNIRKVLVEYDAIDYITDNLKDGDVVRINGHIDFQKYTNQQGKEVSTQKFVIDSITKLDEKLDFESPEFKEESKFEQEIVINETVFDEENKKLIVNAFVIKYGGEVVDATFVVDGNKYPKLANNIAKRCSFGDFLKVYGLIINSVVLKESNEKIEDEDDWGGDEEIQKEFDIIRDYIQELQITSVKSELYEPKKYKEEDLFSEDEDKFNGNLEDEDDDDFEDNNDGFDEEDEDLDDLPFK